MTKTKKQSNTSSKSANKKGKPTKSRLAQKHDAQRKKEAQRQKAAARSGQKQRISDEDVHAMILMLCAAAYPDTAVRPEDVAMALNPDDWQSLLNRVRLFARQLAHAGYVEILRKGKPVDPDDFKGVYRLRATARLVEGPAEEAA